MSNLEKMSYGVGGSMKSRLRCPRSKLRQVKKSSGWTDLTCSQVLAFFLRFADVLPSCAAPPKLFNDFPASTRNRIDGYKGPATHAFSILRMFSVAIFCIYQAQQW